VASILRLGLLVLALALPAAAAAAGTILVFGDSLSGAYGIAQSGGWVALLEVRLKERRVDYSVANASISGETTAGGVARIGKALAQHRPRVVILELGSNDGLRGLPLDAMKKNLAQMIRAAEGAKARVLLVGMKMPPNYGPDYTQQFERCYVELAKQFKLALVPFLLEGIADRRELFLPDNIHPVEAAQPMVLETVWKQLAPLLR
jgi:acyl-CoA thioesterase-1